MKNKIILIVVVILVCSLAGYVGYRFYKNDNVMENDENINSNSGDVLLPNNEETDLTNGIVIDEEKVVENFKITNIKFNYIGVDEYEFLADVENLGSTLNEAKNVDISVLNENGDVISIFGGIIKPLMSNEKGVLKSYVLGNLKGTKSVEFYVIED